MIAVAWPGFLGAGAVFLLSDRGNWVCQKVEHSQSFPSSIVFPILSALRLGELDVAAAITFTGSMKVRV